MMSQDGITVEEVEGGVYRAIVESLPLAVFFAADAAVARAAALRAIRRSKNERVD
tara:strand:- start:329 stop:493 length:165 start_codon:yes stop_codon:yes gene_type:complete